MTPAGPADADAGNRRGIALMVLAVGLLALMDAGMKQLAGSLPPLQVAALRGLASWPLVLAWVLATAPLVSLWRVRWGLHLLRGALAIAMLACFAYALKTLPLSTAYTLFFVAPLLIAALSVPVLGERVGPRRWIAIAVGGIGVLVVLRPSGNGLFSLASAAVLFAAFAYAVSALSVRVLGRSDSVQAMVLWMVTVLALGATALAWPAWQSIPPALWPWVGVVGASGAVGQWAITEAFRLGEASVVAPFEYTALVWGVLLDLTLWGVLPRPVTWLGAIIIVASGLYLLRRERPRSGSSAP